MGTWSLSRTLTRPSFPTKVGLASEARSTGSNAAFHFFTGHSAVNMAISRFEKRLKVDRDLQRRIKDVQAIYKPQITPRKDHKGHKDRRILTEANEANEGLSNAKLNPGRKPPSLLFG